MIPSNQLNKRAGALYDDIDKALVYLSDGTVIEDAINKKTIEGSVLKVFVTLNDWPGRIERIEIYDKDGDVLQVQEMNIVKTSDFKFLAVVEIRVENEVLYGR